MGHLLTVREAAEYLKVHPKTIYEWIYDNRLRPVRIGRSVRVSDVALEEFLHAQGSS